MFVSGENTYNGDQSDAHLSTFSHSSKDVSILNLALLLWERKYHFFLIKSTIMCAMMSQTILCIFKLNIQITSYTTTYMPAELKVALLSPNRKVSSSIPGWGRFLKWLIRSPNGWIFPQLYFFSLLYWDDKIIIASVLVWRASINII